MPRPSSLTRISTRVPLARRATSRIRPSAGLPCLRPLARAARCRGPPRSAAGAPADRRSRRASRGRARLLALHLEPHLLAQLAGQVAHHPREPVEHLPDRRQPRLHHLAVQSAPPGGRSASPPPAARDRSPARPAPPAGPAPPPVRPPGSSARRAGAGRSGSAAPRVALAVRLGRRRSIATVGDLARRPDRRDRLSIVAASRAEPEAEAGRRSPPARAPPAAGRTAVTAPSASAFRSASSARAPRISGAGRGSTTCTSRRPLACAPDRAPTPAPLAGDGPAAASGTPPTDASSSSRQQRRRNPSRASPPVDGAARPPAPARPRAEEQVDQLSARAPGRCAAGRAGSRCGGPVRPGWRSPSSPPCP